MDSKKITPSRRVRGPPLSRNRQEGGRGRPYTARALSLLPRTADRPPHVGAAGLPRKNGDGVRAGTRRPGMGAPYLRSIGSSRHRRERHSRLWRLEAVLPPRVPCAALGLKQLHVRLRGSPLTAHITPYFVLYRPPPGIPRGTVPIISPFPADCKPFWAADQVQHF